MDDNRNRGWFFAALATSIAAITVIAIPILGPRGRVSFSSWDAFGFPFVSIVAEALAIAGLVWMLRIWHGGGRDVPAAWRYRDEVESVSMAEPQGDQAFDDRPIADTRAPGWLLARLELAVGAIVVLLIPILFFGTPTFMGSPWGVGGSSELLGVLANGVVLAVVAEALAIIGLAWMVRIWHGPLRDQVPAWRYRR